MVNRPSLEEIIHFFLSVLFSKNFIKYLNKWVGSFFNDRCIDEGWIENRDRRNDNEIRVVFLQDKIMKKNQQIKMKIIQRDEILLFSHFIHVAMRNASSSFRRREFSSRFLYSSPFIATEMRRVSSETTITTASDSSDIPRAAQWQLPYHLSRGITCFEIFFSEGIKTET